MNEASYEIHARYDKLSASGLGELMGNAKLNLFTRVELLSSALAGNFKELARAYYRTAVLEQTTTAGSANQEIGAALAQLHNLHLEPPIDTAFTALPAYSMGLEFTFYLERPFLSRDDDALYIIDNPVRKDKVFQVPMMAASSWKGALRAAATRQLVRTMGRARLEVWSDEEYLAQLDAVVWPLRTEQIRLFGSESQAEVSYLERWLAERLVTPLQHEPSMDYATRVDAMERRIAQQFVEYLIAHGYRTEKVEGRQGRLHCFTTFFDRIGLEMINPHERERGVGTNPILFECVPTGAQGKFRLLYTPFDYPGFTDSDEPVVTPDEATLRQQVSSDLRLIVAAVYSLFTIYGFGAKTSSGYGLARQQLGIDSGLLIINAPDHYPQSNVPTETDNNQDHRAEIDALVAEFVTRFGIGEFPYWTDAELGESDWGKTRQRRYKQLRAQHPDWDNDSGIWRSREEEDIEDAETSLEIPARITRNFATFDDLVSLADMLAAALGKTDEGGEP